jgi:hypothetical protein
MTSPFDPRLLRGKYFDAAKEIQVEKEQAIGLKFMVE